MFVVGRWRDVYENGEWWVETFRVYLTIHCMKAERTEIVTQHWSNEFSFKLSDKDFNTVN